MRIQMASAACRAQVHLESGSRHAPNEQGNCSTRQSSEGIRGGLGSETPVYIYIYIQRERERERDVYIYTHTHNSHMYTYIHIHIHMHIRDDDLTLWSFIRLGVVTWWETFEGHPWKGRITRQPGILRAAESPF